MFSSIAPRYDLLNHLLSMGTDILWREHSVKELGRRCPNPRLILDAACGTGDMALTLRKQFPQAHITGLDFARPMLERAQQKDQRSRIAWIEGDGMNLPFPDGAFDLVTIAFGIRNMVSLEGALREFHRVLKPGGRLAVLEFTEPENALIRSVYQPYFLHVLPRVGALLSQRSAYRYLPHSVMHFPARRALAGMFRDAGFVRVSHGLLHFGVAALHIGLKQTESRAT